ncbi:hypothetical protein, partial, partial [Parasitella parasitica]
MSAELYQAFIDYILEWRYPEHFDAKQRRGLRYESRKYQVLNGVLYKKPSKDCPTKRQVVKADNVLQILKKYRDHLFAGHQGINNTFQKIRENYYWPGYYDSVRVYVQSCQLCQEVNNIKAQAVPLHPVERSTEGAFAKIGMDYIYTPRTASGYSAALILIDYLTAWVHAEPVSTQSAASTCLVLFRWICQYGCPVQVIADNGTHFKALELKTYMADVFDVHINFGPPFHPQRQGKVERANRTLKNILTKYVNLYKADWDVYLPAALFVMRTTFKVYGGYSPFLLTYGRSPRMGQQPIKELFTEEEQTEEDLLQHINELVRLNEEIIPDAMNKVKVYQEKMKAYYDKHSKDRRFIIGDLVMEEDRSLIKNGNTFVPKWLGPFKVHQRLKKDTYIVADHQLVFPTPYHANQMKKLYKSRPK